MSTFLASYLEHFETDIYFVPGPLGPCLHEYVFISFLLELKTFICVFTLHLHKNN